MREAKPASPAGALILSAAETILGRDPGASIDAITGSGCVSRATFYRHFRSRAELLAALDIQPDPDARERILAAATCSIVEPDRYPYAGSPGSAEPKVRASPASGRGRPRAEK